MSCFNLTEATNVAVYISAVELNIQDNMGASFEQGSPIQRGVYTLYPDLKNYLPKFFSMYQSNVAKFDELLEILPPRLVLKNTNYQAAISPEQKLVLTLRCVCFPCCITDKHTCNKFLETLFPIFAYYISEKNLKSKKHLRQH